jgi:hypothetical protein
MFCLGPIFIMLTKNLKSHEMCCIEWISLNTKLASLLQGPSVYCYEVENIA